MGFLRIGFFAFVILTLFYWALSWYFRSLARGGLEQEWDENVREGDRSEWIDKGMAEYDSSLKKKLVMAVYVIPVIVIVALVYLTNYA